MVRSKRVDDDEDAKEEQQAYESGEDLVYDPDQDREEKRAVRRGYRELQDDEELNDVNTGVTKLIEKIDHGNALFHKVRDPGVATMDSAFLVQASNLGAAKARQMKADTGGFDIDDFVARLVTFMGGRQKGEARPRNREDDEDEDEDDDAIEDDEDEDTELQGRGLAWDKIGRKALAKSRRVPAMTFMLGALNIEQKKKVVRKRVALEKNKEEEVRPQEIKEADMQKSENETTANVLRMKELLQNQEGAIGLFKFVINPESFAQSVENMFYLSFLIRDGECAVQVNEDTKEVEIYLCMAAQDSDYQEGLKKKQMVLELDHATWKRAIEVFEIKKSMIPTRPPAKTHFSHLRRNAVLS